MGEKQFAGGIKLDAESIRVIKSTPGAIGYVSRAPSDVRIIHKF
jgi:hypothetical protein